MKKLQKSIGTIAAAMLMGTMLTSCDVMLGMMDGMAAGMAAYNPYGYTSSFGAYGNNSYLLDPGYAIWQTNQQMGQMNAVQNQLIGQTIKQTEKEMEELNRVNQQLIETSIWQANNGIVLGDNASTSTTIVNGDTYKGKLSPSQYEAAYRRYENSAKSYYNILTSGGIRSQDGQGNIQGKTVGQMAGGSYVSSKQGLRQAQDDMRRIRNEASQYGVHIQQSQWETATAGY